MVDPRAVVDPSPPEPEALLADPAVAVAARGGFTAAVAGDLDLMRLLFKSMAVRDRRIYAQSFAARLYYYGDGIDGRRAAVKIKLGTGTAITNAIDSLRAVRTRVDTARRGQLARLIVLTAFGRAHQETDNGVAVVPPEVPEAMARDPDSDADGSNDSGSRQGLAAPGSI